MHFIDFLTEQMPTAGVRRRNVPQQETTQQDVQTFLQRLPQLLQRMSLGELRALDKALLQAGQGKFQTQQPQRRTTTTSRPPEATQQQPEATQQRPRTQPGSWYAQRASAQKQRGG